MDISHTQNKRTGEINIKLRIGIHELRRLIYAVRSSVLPEATELATKLTGVFNDSEESL